MTPNQDLVKIETSEEKITSFMQDVMLKPRLNSLKWSEITKQTPGLRVGYPAQHLASLITGVEGSRTGARGDDLKDGTEVKACNRIDQLDTCKNCSEKVLRMEHHCSFCGSQKINRKRDSKWLIAIRTQEELELYTKKIDRALFILLDYPNFDESDFETMRICAYEIWPKSSPLFCQLLEDYYNKIYLEHIAGNPNKTPAPKNFWPYTFQFYVCKPIKTFECWVYDANSNPTTEVKLFIKPEHDRSQLIPEGVPVGVLSPEEFDLIFANQYKTFKRDHPEFSLRWQKYRTYSNAKRKQILKQFSRERHVLPSSYLDGMALRDTSKATPHTTPYLRR